jgi:quinol monooxygenase YgiN
MIVIVLRFRAVDGHIDQARQAAQANATASRELEPGCIQFDVVELDERGWLMLCEQFLDEEAIDQHLRCEHYRKWRDALQRHVVPESIVKTAGLLRNA